MSNDLEVEDTESEDTESDNDRDNDGTNDEHTDTEAAGAASKPLNGYRIAYFTSVDEDRLQLAGADLLHIIPPSSVHETFVSFLEWWKRETERAWNDHVQLVVVKPCYPTLLREWLQRIEEEEWYGQGEKTTRVRFTTVYKLAKAVSCEEPLRDDWNDIIERVDSRPQGKKRQVVITRYFQNWYIRREKRHQSSSPDDDSSSVDRPQRQQSRITCYFQQMNR